MNHKPKAKSGFSRIWAALFYSLNGFRFAISNEAAFRQEAGIALVVLAALLFLPVSSAWKGLLFFATTAVLVVELLNSAIETIVDMVSPEYHDLAKRAKDLGSAAVLSSIVFATLLWGIAIFIALQGYTK